MLKDRGKSKKWQGFFMTEHVSALKKIDRDYYKLPRPELDETQIEEMEEMILEAYKNESLIELETWKDGYFTIRSVYVKKIDPINKKIQVIDELDSIFNIDFFSITKVKT